MKKLSTEQCVCVCMWFFPFIKCSVANQNRNVVEYFRCFLRETIFLARADIHVLTYDFFNTKGLPSSLLGHFLFTFSCFFVLSISISFRLFSILSCATPRWNNRIRWCAQCRLYRATAHYEKKVKNVRSQMSKAFLDTRSYYIRHVLFFLFLSRAILDRSSIAIGLRFWE